MTERGTQGNPDEQGAVAESTASPRAVSWPAYLLQPVDPASAAVFRILFGLLLAKEALIYIRNGWVLRYFSPQNFPFSYYGFEWVEPMGMQEMHGVFLFVAITGLMVAAGFLYRIAAPIFFVTLTYWFLLDMSGYLNHMYLVCVYAFLLMFIPTHRGWSLDALVFRHSYSGYFPRWGLWVLRLQMGLVYFYGAIAKINRDWLIEGEPLRTWLGNRSDKYLLGPLLQSDFAPWFFSWSGFLIDLVAFPLLLWKRTRMAMFLVLLSFHLTNHYLFNIGIFPFLSIAATLLFFGASWPRMLLRWPPWRMPDVRLNWRVAVVPFLLIPVVLIQVLAPLRHHLYASNVAWSEEGHRFAWRMKLRTKRAEGYFMVQTADMRHLEIVRPEDHLPRHQLRSMITRPDMILQFAHHLARDAEKRWGQPAQVFAHVTCQLNHHKPQLLIDPTVDLAKVPRSLAPADWILPFTRSPQRFIREEVVPEAVDVPETVE
jgi:hypothetical protein